MCGADAGEGDRASRYQGLYDQAIRSQGFGLVVLTSRLELGQVKLTKSNVKFVANGLHAKRSVSIPACSAEQLRESSCSLFHRR